jgi:hypothetical protein
LLAPSEPEDFSPHGLDGRCDSFFGSRETITSTGEFMLDYCSKDALALE